MQIDNIIVQKGHLSTIIGDDKLIGVIYHDTKTHNKILYKCVEMEEEEIADLMTREGPK